ncbi:diguanylate cyclase [Stutzerimonas stutzeri]|uniref:Diguanylate cyclase n=1 Tax=Stutzerimonas stutzeri TaxID=316 RepID=W8R322_STUST|nr:HD family phosphohydrolase [Stutzerimonas stutzeri]AHL73928.1 diguanylate cyclase [Stutzerimonas stutzeri]MCQ4328550.1 GAF domain-containing protein [Stutzerimonas stutzeri]
MTSSKYKLSYEAWASALVTMFVLVPTIPALLLVEFAGFDLRSVLLIELLIMFICLPLLFAGLASIRRSLSALAEDTRRIRQLDFGIRNGPGSLIREFDDLHRQHNAMRRSLQAQNLALEEAQEKLASLVENGMLLSSERDKHRLLQHILMQGKRICNADAATLYLMTDQDSLRFTLRSKADQLPAFELPLHDPETGVPNERHVSTYVALRKETVVIDDVYRETRFDLSGTRRFDMESGYRTVSMLCVPLIAHGGEVLGVLQFMNAKVPGSDEVVSFSRQSLGFVEALASQSAVALENHNLIDSQTALIDSMIEILAGAIDAKSAYTGGHCARVPELALMLAEKASASDDGPLADFRFETEEQWREFRIGAWLHDCGKITTPEHIVDKATKLETVYNRIHEIRMRFEVLLRDAMIERHEALDAGEARETVDARHAATVARLQEEFAFVAECNIGGELMAPERIGRLQRIGEQRWMRYFDDRLGISHEETTRLEAFPSQQLPASETLLADKPEHLIQRLASKALDPKYGFKMTVPEYQFNFGELYNLSIDRGTLTAEERFKVNEHIVQTIVMLENLPFPKNLQRVPEYAGTHHETLLGTGYPRQLGPDQLSIPARIMAIADIFEALTACDRPYKKAKPLSESIRILARLRDRGHIDADLFDLFLSSGLHLTYGARHLRPEQLDQVDITEFLLRPVATPT